MGWDRQPPAVLPAPMPPVLGRWLVAAVLAVLIGVLLFLLYASERVPLLQTLNVWVLSGSPLLALALAFGVRAFVYGGALNRYRFLDGEAQVARQAWQDWAQRSVAVLGSCVVLPDQVSASVLMQARSGLPPRPGVARRMTLLPHTSEERAQAGLQLLLPALASALEALPESPALRVTLLNDTQPDQYEALRRDWQRCWTRLTRLPCPETVTLVAELPYSWLDDKLKSASNDFELIIILQVQGGSVYSDGLAALLLCPDGVSGVASLPVAASLLRPMPLVADKHDSELPLFLQTQAQACQATGLLADHLDLQALTGDVLTAGAAEGAGLSAQQVWVLEQFCGLAGPFSSLRLAALAVEMARHQQGPLLMLSREQSRYWISTVIPGDKA